MRAMILAAGLGTRLRPMTYSMPKPMVPVLNRPVMAHIARLLARHGFEDVVANLHYFPETIQEYFGDGSAHRVRISYEVEEELLGTAGGVRNVREFFGDESFVVISGDALTDIDLSRMREVHDGHGGIATLAVKKVTDTREYGVVITDGEGRISGFQEKPEPEEALSDLGNCGIYMFRPEIFDHFPPEPFVDWANDVFPALLAADVPFYAHEIEEYWNDVGSLEEYRQSNFDAITGAVAVEHDEEEIDTGLFVGDGTDLGGVTQVEPPVFVGENCSIGAGVRLEGPVVIGNGCRLGEGAMLRDTVVWPGAEIGPGELVIHGIVGHRDVAEHLT